MLTGFVIGGTAHVPVQCLETWYTIFLLSGEIEYLSGAASHHDKTVAVLRYAEIGEVKNLWLGDRVADFFQNINGSLHLLTIVHLHEASHVFQNKNTRSEFLDKPQIIEEQIPVLLMLEAYALEVFAILREALVGRNAERLARRPAMENALEGFFKAQSAAQYFCNTFPVSHVAIEMRRAYDQFFRKIVPKGFTENLVDFHRGKIVVASAVKPNVEAARTRKKTDGWNAIGNTLNAIKSCVSDFGQGQIQTWFVTKILQGQAPFFHLSRQIKPFCRAFFEQDSLFGKGYFRWGRSHIERFIFASLYTAFASDLPEKSGF